jgi:hypothetical protein
MLLPSILYTQQQLNFYFTSCSLQGPGRPAGPAGSLLVLEEAASELLDYLRCLDAASMAELTGSVGPEAAAAMDSFVARLMGTGDRDSLSRAGSDCIAQVGAEVCRVP